MNRIGGGSDDTGVRPVGSAKAATGDRIGSGPSLKSDEIRPFAPTKSTRPAPRADRAAPAPDEPPRPARREVAPGTIPPIDTQPPKRVPTGIELLDHLLDGGLPADGVVQVYGPSFLGKEQLVQTMFLGQMQQGNPAIMVLTHECVEEVRQRLREYEPAFEDYERDGLAWFVDTCTRQFGGTEDYPNARYAQHGDDLEGVRAAVEEIRGKLGARRQHMMVFDSVSTLAVNTDPQVLFRYLQQLVGHSRLNGGLSVLMLDDGMHVPRHVAMLRHLSTGVLRLQGAPDKHQLLVEGLTEGENPGWVDYEFTDTEFRVTGSLAGGRIR